MMLRARTTLFAALILVCCTVTNLYSQSFTEVASSKGINLDGNKDGGFTFADLNDDGYLDLIVNTDQGDYDHRTQMYFNDGPPNYTFTNVTDANADGLDNVISTGCSEMERCAVAGDLNNDGYVDFIRNSSCRVEVWLNQGPTSSPPYSFGTSSQTANWAVWTNSVGSNNPPDGIPNGMNTEGIGFFDYDNDGDLDLMIENHNWGIDIYRNEVIPSGSFSLTHMTPGSSTALGLPQSATDGDYGSVTDFDDDGYIDLIARKRDQEDFFRNLGNGTFQVVPTSSTNFNEQASNSNKGAVSLYDFDNDGDYDLVWTDNDPNQIWQQTGVGSGSFTATGEPWASAGIHMPSSGIDGIACGDIDNDGDVDLFFGGDHESYLFINTTPPGSTNLSFTRSTAISTSKNVEGCSFVDFDQDGDLDLYLNIRGNKNQLWRNNLNNDHYLFVDVLENIGNTIPNRAAIGANVVLKDCDGTVLSGVREVNGGNGHGTQDPSCVHFGLPLGADYDYVVEVHYPYLNGTRKIVQDFVNPSEITGAYQVFGITPQSTLTVLEPTIESNTGSNAICPGGSLVLSTNAADSYLWSTGATTPTITVSTPGYYSVTVTYGTSCSAESDNYQVVNATAPTATIVPTGDACSIDSVVICELTNATSKHGLWLNNMPGASSNYYHVIDAEAIAYPNGSLHLTATFANQYNNNQRWQANVWYTDKKDWNAWSAQGGSWKGNPSTVGSNYINWDYYIMDTTRSNTIVGLADFAGRTINITHRPSNYYYAFQVGQAANDFTGDYGMSGWFEYTGYCGGHGDFNFDAACIDSITISSSCNGIADLTVTGGKAPYSYIWSNGNQSQDANHLCVGNYTVTVTDANGCTTTATTTITDLGDITITCNSSNVTSQGGNDGVASVNVSGGVPPYTYVWSTGSTSQTISGLSAGCYTVTVTDRDGAGCSSIYTCMITQPSVCAGFRTQTPGGWGAMPNGGNPGTYLHNNFASAFPGGLTVGCPGSGNTLTLTSAQAVTDFLPSGSTPRALTQNLTDPAGTYRNVLAGHVVALSLSIGFDNYDNNFGPSNTLLEDLVVSGGLFDGMTVSAVLAEANNKLGGCSSSFSFSDLTNALSAINENYVDGLNTGNYLVCGLDLLTVKVDVACTGENTGSIDLTVNGGVTPYAFIWSNGATTEDITNLTAGTYTVTVTDDNGLTASTSATIEEPVALVMSLNSTDACYDDCNGTVTLSLSGGVTPYTITWNNGTTTENINDLCAGTYSVTVTDANGCSKIGATTIVEGSEIELTISHTDVTCNPDSLIICDLTNATYRHGLWLNSIPGDPSRFYNVVSAQAVAYSDGSLHITGTFKNENDASRKWQADVWYTGKTDWNAWSALGRGWKGDASFVNGNYVDWDYYIMDTSKNNVVIGLDFHAGKVLNITHKPSNYYYGFQVGQGANDFTADFGMSGWFDFTGSYTGTGDFNFDAACVDSVINHSVCDGIAEVTVTGGELPYTFAWSNGSSDEDQLALCQGTYEVTITDAAGCSVVDTVVIDTIPCCTDPILTAVGTDEDCYGACTGSIDLTVSNGVGAYTFLWSNGETTEDLADLCPGSYNVTVTDQYGCEKTLGSAVVISGPSDALSPGISNTPVDCFGALTGTATATASGGTPPYGFSWSNGRTTAAITGLSAGTYTVTITDANGCDTIIATTVTQPGPLTLGLVPTPVDCAGGDNGEIDLTVTGGTAPFNFAWSNGATTEDITGLSTGTYSVTVTDANGCQATGTSTVNEPSPISASITPNDVDCYGDATGSADLSISGGTSPYTYSWSNGASTEDLNNITAGSYSVTVTDALGCTATASTTVEQPNELTATITPSDASCDGFTDGSIDLSVSGGTTPYTFVWSNSATTEDLSSVGAGSYSVTITDANGCSVVKSTTVEDPTELTATITPSDASCDGFTDGSVDVSVSGGTTPYTFAWSNGATTEDLSSVGAGSYSVTITDANGCSVVKSTTVEDPTELTASASSTPVDCFGALTGTATVTATGGTAPYTYSWNTTPARTTATITGLRAGSYAVTVTDANGCSATASTTVTQPGPLTLGLVPTPVNCANGTDGAIDLTVTGGTSPFTYVWNNGATTEDLTGIAAGTYTVTVTDANGCQATGSSTVTEPDPIAANATPANVTCNGFTDGSISLTVTGGTSPFTYSWSNGATTRDLSSIGAGSYSVTITDANSCTATASATLTEPTELTTSITGNDISCYSEADGAADLTISGGTTPYTFAWSNGAATEDISGLVAGTYTVTIIDANNCTSTETVTLTQPDSLTTEIEATDVSCAGDNGVCRIFDFGGNDSHAFWLPSLPNIGDNFLFAQGGGFFEELPGGKAHIYGTIYHETDTNYSWEVDVWFSDKMDWTAWSALGRDYKDEAGVAGNNYLDWDYYIFDTTRPSTLVGRNIYAGDTVVLTHDPPNYEFGLQVGLAANSKTADFGMATWFRLNGAFTGKGDINVNLNCVSSSCDGAADLSVNGGTMPYTYSWSNGETTQDLSTLCEGTYEVTITDANGCTAIDSVTIESGESLSVDAMGTNATCAGNCDGSADVMVTGGTAPYTYLWSTGDTTMEIDGLCNGWYTVTVTDSLGCFGVDSLMINNTPLLTVSATTTPVDCKGNATGSVSSNVTGGTAPFAYSWSNGASTANLSNVVAGTYGVTVTDANGCSNTASATVSEPTDSLSATASSTPVDCFGAFTGTASVTASGGTAPYTYLWNTTPARTTASITGLRAGSYSVTVTDANGCITTAATTVTQPGPLTLGLVPTPVNCANGADGAIDLTVSGGTAPFSYVWSNGDTTEDITGLSAGIYTVTVTDANNCQATGSSTVNEPQPLIASAIATDATCNGFANGSVDLTVTGGSSPFTYSWSNGDTTQNLSGITAGTYTVTVTDRNGCTDTASATITEPIELITSLTGDDISCYGENDGSADLTVSGGTTPYTISWSTGDATEDISGLTAGLYGVTIVDANGCSSTETITLTQPDTLTAEITGFDVSCGGGDDICRVFDFGGTNSHAFWLPSLPNIGDNFLFAQGGGFFEELPGGKAHIYGTIYHETDTNYSWEVDVWFSDKMDWNAWSALGRDYKDERNLAGNNYLDWDYYIFDTTRPSTLVGRNIYAGDTVVLTHDPPNYEFGLQVGLAANSKTADFGMATWFRLNGAFTGKGDINATLNCVQSSCDGAADLAANGGTLPYTYTWSNGDTTEDLDELCDGTYSVTVTDANGCTAVDTVTIESAPTLTVDAMGTNVSCSANCDGTANVMALGGTAPFTYNWSTGDTTMSISGLCGGWYTVTVSDSLGCAGIDSVFIDSNPLLTVAATALPVDCYGNATGSVTSTVTGGVTPYSYTWSTGDTTADISGLVAGTYGLTVVDANGCSNTASATVTQPTDSLDATTGSTPVSCFGGFDGTAFVTATGGTAPYTYVWSTTPVRTTDSITGLRFGSYSVTVTDANGCDVVRTVLVTQPGPLTLGSIPSPVSCAGGNDGAVDLTVSGGTAPYMYSWSTGDTTQDIAALSVGNYSVTVMDANGCDATLNIAVNEPQPIALSLTATDVDCYGNSTGAIDLTVTGGSSPFTYVWSNGDTTQNLSDLTAGNYIVTVTDRNGCIASDSVQVNQPDTLTAIASSTPVDCFGAFTGTADVTVAGGAAPYTFVWNTTPARQTAMITGLRTGSYSVTITDANGCTTTTTTTVTQPGPLTLGLVPAPVNCAAGNDGSIDLTVNGGTPGFTYLWSTGDTTEDVSGLVAGTYTVTVTDANGCQATGSSVVTEPQPISLAIVETDVACNGAGTGAIDLTVTGGSSPFTYTWSTGDTTQDLTGLSGGDYYVTVTDRNGCVAIDSATISESAMLMVSATNEPGDCYGFADGAAFSTPNGGTAPYTYLWSTGDTTQNVLNLSAGVYSVTVADANGCTGTASTTIMEPDTLTASANSTPVDCFGAFTGTADVTVTGGTAPYTYAWGTIPVRSTAMITGLRAGVYTVTITDANGCIATATTTVTQPGPLTLGLVPAPVNCAGGDDGSIDLTVSGGTPGFTYLWSTGDTTEDVSGLTAGTYEVTVTDANGCQATGSSTVGEPQPIVLSLVATDVDCYGNVTGEVDLTVTGGSSPFTYAWSSGVSTQDITGLSAGTYVVTVTDRNNCVAIDSVEVDQPDTLTALASSTPVDCFGAFTGTANVNATGGTAPYTYVWSTTPARQTAMITGLRAGTYSVTITDAKGCITTASTIVTQPGPLTLGLVPAPVNCAAGNDGSIDLTVSGGTPGFTYLWSTGDTTQDVSGLTAGTYGVTVTDANGCQATGSSIVTQPQPISLSVVETDVACNGAGTGAVDLTVNGGSSPFTYNWSNGATTQDITGLSGGTYYITVTDRNGCIAIDSASITESAVLVVDASNQPGACNGFTDGSVSSSPSGGTAPYSYLWSTGDTTQNVDDLIAGAYSVTVTDANGCTGTASTTLIEPALLTAQASSTNALCNGAADGTVTVVVAGGTPAYTYAWSNGGATQSVNGLVAGTYTVTVTDLNGCTTSASTTVSQPNALDLTANGSALACFGDNNGTADISYIGGTAPYAVTWSTGATSDSLTGLSAGSYSVTLTDANGCSVTTTTVVSQPDSLNVSFVAQNVNCNGGITGAIDLSVSGGTAPYSYVWTNGVDSATTQDLEFMPAGTYFGTVTDANGCMESITVTLTEPTEVELVAGATPVSCFGALDGSVSATASGGVPPYTYEWNTTPIRTTPTVTGLRAGVYTVVVLDANGCGTSETVTVTQPGPLTLGGVPTPISCAFGNDGEIDLTVSGGTAPFRYNWSNGDTTQDINFLTSGTYSVVVTDANLCTATLSVVVSEPQSIVLSTLVTDVSVSGGSDGAIDLTIVGGTSPFTYTWSNGATTQDITGLAAGQYCVTVLDANGCISDLCETVDEPQCTGLALSLNASDVLCHDDTSGSIQSNVSGGTAPFTYAWSNGASSADLSNIGAGSYSLTVTDAVGCSVIESVSVGQPQVLGALVQSTDVSCNGAANGTASVSVSGGTAPYTYSWSTNASTDSIGGLSGGQYAVTITDANGCQVVRTVVIGESAAISVSAVVTNVRCFLGSDGAITLTVNGGTAPYTYAWSNGSTTRNLTALRAGSYTVTVTDANGCTASLTRLVAQPGPLTLGSVPASVSCFQGNDGSIDLTVTGGTAPYSYIWSNGATTQDVSGLAAGTYTVTVTGAQGCIATLSSTVLEPQPIALTAMVGVACEQNADGSINMSVAGGTSPFTYAWSNGATTQDLNNITAGSYSVTVTDVNGCVATNTFNVGSSTNCLRMALDVRVFLEGPLQPTSGLMYTKLNTQCDVLPRTQPYNSPATQYAGSESVSSFDPNIVDWVLVSFRTGTDRATEVYKFAGLLRNDGQVLTVTGDSIITFTHNPSDSVYVVVMHRNHMGVMSPVKYAGSTLNNNPAIVDFRYMQSYQVGSPATAGQLAKSVNGKTLYSMYSGDGNCTFDINSNDFVPLGDDFNKFNIYSPGDYNMDCDCNSNDIPRWVENFNMFSIVR